MKIITTILIIFSTVILSYGQTKEKLKGKPTTLEETFPYLDRMFDNTSLYGFMTLPEDVATSRLHMGLGMWIRNHWGLWRNSKLKHYFIDKGITHPDNMSGIILTSYHRHLNNIPIDLNGQIKEYKEWTIKHGQTEVSSNDITRGCTTDSMLLNYFPVGDTILTYVYATRKSITGAKEGSSVQATAIVRKHQNNKLEIQILKIENDSELTPDRKVGDIFEESPYYCSLLPPKGWKFERK